VGSRKSSAARLLDFPIRQPNLASSSMGCNWVSRSKSFFEQQRADNCGMFLDQSQLNMNDDRTSPLGLRISAFLLAASGCLFALYALMSGALLSVFAVRGWQNHVPKLDKPSSLLILLMSLAINTALTYLCFRAAAALLNARRWAAYVATGFGLLLLLLSAQFFYDWFHPDRQSPDEYWLVLVVPLFIAIGLSWCIYLNLPRVRAYLN
jgi:hypothetical protein